MYAEHGWTHQLLYIHYYLHYHLQSFSILVRHDIPRKKKEYATHFQYIQPSYTS